MGLEALSDADLMALKAGDLTKVSDAGLMALKQPDAKGGTPLPANAGVANFVSGVVGSPMDIVQGVANVPTMLYGAAKAATTGKAGPDVPVTNIPGGSENIRQMLRTVAEKTGIKGFSPDNPNPNDKMGTAQYNFTSRGGFIPGGALSAIGSMIAEKIGGPEWSGVGSVVPNAAIAGFNAARASGLARAEAQNRVRDTTLRAAQDAGYVLPPSAVQPTLVGNAVESFGGKAAMKQQAEIKNQQVTNSLVRREFGLPENTPLTEGVLDGIRARAGVPYQQVSALSPLAQNTLQRLRDARAEANVQYRHYDRTATPESLRNARRLDAESAMLERVLEREAVRRGRPDLVPKMREARTEIAKTWDVERALNVGDGNVDAKVIGRALDRGRPLSGNLETIGRFAEGPGRQFTREASAVPAPGVSALNLPLAALLGEQGFQHFGPAGALAAGIPYARGGVRSVLLSDAYQNAFNRPNYTPNMMPQGIFESAIQQAVIANQGK